MNLEIRHAKDSDSHYLVDIDRKAYEHPFDIKDWQSLALDFPTWDMCIATLDYRHCAYSLCEDNRADNVMTIHRLGVVPNFRGRGVGGLLLHRLEYKAVVQHMKSIEIPLPETSCQGHDDPYDVTGWLQKRGYRCVRTQENLFLAYGRHVDGYIFGKSIQDIKLEA